MAGLISFKCKNCGASVRFDARSGKMKCPYCDSLFSVFAFKDTKSVWQDEDDIEYYECGSCGGHIGVDKTSTSVFCPYCDSTAIIRARLSGKSRPDYIIPFRLNKKQAVAQFKKHLRDKKLLPRVFKSDAKINECRGIYVPFWVFNTNAAIVAKATVQVDDSTITVTSTAKAPVRKLPVDCSEKIPNDITESLEPFDFGKAVPFMPSYLAGYFADMHDTDKDACISLATQRISDGLLQQMRKQIAYRYGGRARFDEVAMNFDDSYALYSFFPVWLLNVSWKNKRYTFAVNGQTGKFVGNLPCSYKKLLKMFFSIFGPIFAAGCILLLIASVIMK